MAYSTLPTQSAGQTASSAGWANIVKADLESMMHLIVRKTSDESVTSSTTLQDDDALQMSVAANEVWQLRFGLRMSISPVGNAKVSCTFPAGGEIELVACWYDPSGNNARRVINSNTPVTSLLSFAAIAYIEFNGIYVNAGNAGTLVLQWAQDTSNGTATIMKAHSTLWGMKLA